MNKKQNPDANEEALDAFIKKQLELLNDDLDVNTFMTTIHVEASKNTAHDQSKISVSRDGRPNWIHFS